jgi:hypothetical protein
MKHPWAINEPAMSHHEFTMNHPWKIHEKSVIYFWSYGSYNWPLSIISQSRTECKYSLLCTVSASFTVLFFIFRLWDLVVGLALMSL